MMQSSLFQFFNVKNSKSAAPPSPTTKKQTAIKNLKKLAKVDDDDEFDLSDTLESDSDDEKEFSKVVTKEKIMKSNKSAPKEYSEEYDDIDDYDEQSSKSSKKRVKAPKNNKSPSRAKTSSKGSRPQSPLPFSPSITPSSSMESLSKAAASDEVTLPSWLSTDLKDANKRRPDDPEYDPTTVYIPPSAEKTFTPFQAQFWEIKRNNFDAIVMIRKGKFYEMFSTDAIFARDVLKLRLTARGKEPMCGVPEKAFGEWAIKIINAGKRVCKVEQMETAVDQRNRKTGEKTITRELVQIYSLGTIDDFEMLESSQPSFLMAIRSSGRSVVGVCLVDCSTASFYLGIVNEDDLMDILIRFEPVEIVYNRDTLYPEHFEVVKRICGAASTHAKAGSQWWDPQLAQGEIQRIAGWTEFPQSLQKVPKEALAALGGCVAYLNDHKIAKPLLSLQNFSPLDNAGSSRYLSLDSSALTNLQIIGNDDNCLLHILDRCSTSFGKRRLRFWIMHPLRSIDAINQRLDAIDELNGKDYVVLPKQLQSFPDLERILARVYSNRCNVKIFLDCLESLQNAAKFIKPLEGKFTSTLLKNLTMRVNSSKLLHNLAEISDSIEKSESLEANELIVKHGVFPDIDEIDEEVKDVDRRLHQELDSIKKEIGCKNICFTDIQSERYQVQIPINYTSDLDDDFTLISQNKQYKRYRTTAIKDLITELENVENKRLKRRSGCHARFIRDFSKHSTDWNNLVDTLAELDCLLSLASASKRWAKPACRPKFIEKNDPLAGGRAYINIKQMRHPCIDQCTPNDVLMSNKYVLIITGPNSSGKSTFARMCCIGIVLAQLGCYLPAEEATLTVFDQIFTRIGAGDRLFSGQSTFAVELSETARLMKNSTSDSFVVLDELGRGTSTFDGVAIATAVLEFFLQQKQCPLVFCTHYHIITQQFQSVGPVRNVSMKYRINDKKLVLLHELIDGPCLNSFGCAVARMCGLSDEITREAQQIADDFDERHSALHAQTDQCQITKIELREDFVQHTEKVIEILDSNAMPLAMVSELDKEQKEIKKLDLG